MMIFIVNIIIVVIILITIIVVTYGLTGETTGGGNLPELVITAGEKSPNLFLVRIIIIVIKR